MITPRIYFIYINSMEVKNYLSNLVRNIQQHPKRGSLFYKTKSSAGGKLSFLDNLVGVFEHEVDELGNTTGKVWEWK